MQNIKNNDISKIKSRLYNANYYDFMLSKNSVSHAVKDDAEDNIIANFSSLNFENGKLYSDVVWRDAINNGVELNDIGFTGIDNGLIHYEKDRISNQDFLNIYTGSTYTIPSGDTRLFLSPITGNTQLYKYPMKITEINSKKEVSFKGGFFQGFFKLDGFEYQTLPSKLEGTWGLSFHLRPRTDYDVEDDTLNFAHPENKGLFFYMGIRAENKFWEQYNVADSTKASFKKNGAFSDGYISENEPDDCIISKNNEGWLAIDHEPGSFSGFPCDCIEETIADKKGNDANSDDSSASILPTPAINNLNNYNFRPEGPCGCADCGDSDDDSPEGNPCGKCCGYYGDEYFEDVICPDEDNGKSIEEDYLGYDVEINAGGYADTEGHEPGKRGYFSINTDNKFLLFDRTSSGFTTDTWKEGTMAIVTGRTDYDEANYFTLFDRTSSGYTVNTIDNYRESHVKEFDVYKDIRGNAFALRITDDGRIGYRYGILNCDAENKYEVVEEYSKPNIVLMDEWNNILVKIQPMNNMMRIYFYVNGFLIFISKTIPILDFHRLDDVSERQEGVPYNISLGGGTQGLIETIYPDYYKLPKYCLPIERDFCGTFLGDLDSFKMLVRSIDYSLVQNYLSVK